MDPIATVTWARISRAKKRSALSNFTLLGSTNTPKAYHYKEYLTPSPLYFRSDTSGGVSGDF
jgi:hypothetical protein